MTFNLPIIIGAFSGALLCVPWIKRLKPWERIWYVLSGGVLGTVLTPILSWWFSMPKELQSGVAGLLGAFLMILVIKVINANVISAFGVSIRNNKLQ